MLNKIVLMGRMTKDPEIRAMANGKTVALFSLAVERDFKNADGQRDTDFINCAAFGSTAEFVKAYFHKGSMAVTSGRLQIRSYKDKDGNSRTASEVIADSIYFGESKREAKPVDVEYSDTVAADGALPF